MMLVSIIINNYNYAKFLSEAIDSALNQTYKNIEVIVVDDGSNDDSKKVIKSFGDKVKAVFKSNGGQASAYNIGFAHCRGEIVCMLDSDDTLLHECISSAVNKFEKLEIVSKVQWPLWIADVNGDRNGEVTTKRTPPEGNIKEFILQEGPFYDFYLHVGSAYSRKFMESVFPMPEVEYRNGADVYLTTLAPLFGEIRNIKDPLGTYRVHGANNYAGKILDKERIINYLKRFESNCDMLFKFATDLGLAANPELWKANNFNYLWPKRLLQAKEDIEHIIPQGEIFILINEDEWGTGDIISNRMAIPFMEVNGQYNGIPDDDRTAINELERLRDSGSKYLVLWWTCYWWIDHFPLFFQYLERKYKLIVDNDRLRIFSL